MKKKCGTLGAGLLMMSLLAGCSNQVSHQESQGQVQAEKLTEQVDVTICLDSTIESYLPIQNFSYKLFEENIAETNPVLSPVSAYLALTLTGAGAEGDTLEEFHEVMGENLESIPNELMTDLPRDEEGMNILLANSAWIDQKLTADKDWLALADSVYKAEVYQTTLATQSAMQDINTWINKNTQGLIPMLLDKPLGEQARLALFNTIYFKGKWRNSFTAESTSEREFTKEDGTIEKVEMMQMYREKQQYVKNDIAEGVILPYMDEDMVFVALKPVGDLTVREMYEQLSIEEVSGFLQEEKQTLCNLRLPKFEVEFDKALNESLISMGLESAFEEGLADFSGIGTTDSGEAMYISFVRQKAVVIVDEEGTEAAAVTAVIMKECASIEMDEEIPIDIYFDEPFLYMIMDKEREIPLFIGIMDDPNA